MAEFFPSPNPIVPPIIRLATEADLIAINDIYNHYVLHATSTYQEEPETIAARRAWLREHDAAHPITIAEIDSRVVGWGSLSVYHRRSAYRYTVEDSIYIHHDFHRRGVGSALLEDLIGRARNLGYHVIVAGADTEQAGSVALHEKFGFEHVAHFKQVGFKFGRWLDVVYMQLMLDARR